ncbi:hypothetical protein V8G54_011040 [Vigna mungo]|uniref:Uncharacterized protein n=1 Tax=Vigna mungo TaxID=3915 RepID=A0AAQ3S2P0_VIGMU
MEREERGVGGARQGQPTLSMVASFVGGGGDSPQRSNDSPLSLADGSWSNSGEDSGNQLCRRWLFSFVVVETCHREAIMGPIDDGCHRRRLGLGGDDFGSKPHHRCDLDSWSERRVNASSSRVKEKGQSGGGPPTGNTVNNGVVVVRVVPEATTSMQWRPI